MSGVLIKRGNLNTETFTEGKWCKETGRTWPFRNQKWLRLPEFRREAGTNPLLVPSEGAWSCQHLDLRLLVFRIV